MLWKCILLMMGLLFVQTVIAQVNNCYFQRDQLVTLSHFKQCLEAIPMQSPLYYRTVLNDAFHKRFTLKNNKPSSVFLSNYVQLLSTLQSSKVLKKVYQSDFEVHGLISDLFRSFFPDSFGSWYKKPYCYSAFDFVLPVNLYEGMELVGSGPSATFTLKNITLRPIIDDYVHIYDQYMELYPSDQGNEHFEEYYKWKVTVINGRKAAGAIQRFNDLNAVKLSMYRDSFTHRPAHLYPVPDDETVYLDLQHFDTYEETTFRLHFTVLSRFQGDLRELSAWCQQSVDELSDYVTPKCYLDTVNIKFMKSNTRHDQCLIDPEIQYLDEVCQGNTFREDHNCPTIIGHSYYGHICNPFTGRFDRRCILHGCAEGYEFRDERCV